MDAPQPPMEGPIADTHVHVEMMEDPALMLAQAAANGVDMIGCLADAAEQPENTFDHLHEWIIDAQTILSEWALDGRGDAGEDGLNDEDVLLAPLVRTIVGVHPHNASQWDDAMEARLRQLLARPETVALGEVGLDYYYDLSPRDDQRRVFRRQIGIAQELGLPIMLHLRDCHDEAFAILEEEGWPAAGTILHCCSIGPEQLQPWIDRDAYVAFGGATTFGRSADLRASAALVPENRLLLETDGPYMAPEPFRGTQCTSAMTLFTAAVVAQARGIAPGPDRAAFLAQVHRNSEWLLCRDNPVAAAVAATSGEEGQR